MFDTRRIVCAAGEDVVKVYDKVEGRHWDCGAGVTEADQEKKPAIVERVRVRDGYLIEGRRDGVVEERTEGYDGRDVYSHDTCAYALAETEIADSVSGTDEEDEVTSPVSPPRRTRTTPSTSERDEPDAHDDDEDDLRALAQRPLSCSLKHDRRTGNGMRSLRRRPFLIFDRIEAKGYKHLEKTPHVGKTGSSLRYQPGDGFSRREAKPNGSNLLARNGKMTFTSPHIGVLDLTQSELPAAERRRAARRSHRDDNSFESATRKKWRPQTQ
ncbi:hypothetical protein VTH06DRAFT_1377 [Thermothelomyces fergusii]